MGGEPGQGPDERPIDLVKYLEAVGKRGDAVIPLTSLRKDDIIELDLLKGDEPEKAKFKVSRTSTNFDFYEHTGNNPKVTVTDPGPLPEELRGRELRFQGALMAGTALAPDIIREGFPLELYQKSESGTGKTIVTPRITNFSIKRPGASGGLEEVPLNALTRKIESATFDEYQQLIQEAIEQSGKGNKTKYGFEAISRGGLRSHDYVFSPYANEAQGPNPDGPRNQVYIFSKDKNEVYALDDSSRSTESRLRLGVYSGIGYQDILQMRDDPYISFQSLARQHGQRIVYNASSTSKAIDGGVFFTPAPKDISSLGYPDKLDHRPEILIFPDDEVDIHAPTVNLPGSEDQIEAQKITSRKVGVEFKRNKVNVRMGKHNVSFSRTPDFDHIKKTLANVVGK